MTTVLKNEICILCTASNLEILIPDTALPDKIHVLRCKSCGLVFLESRAASDELDEEEAVYWDKGDQKEIYLKEDVQKTFLIEFVNRMETIERILKKSGNLLDVGCGIGHFLHTAKKRGWKTSGLDISKAAVKTAQEFYGLDAHVGTLETPIFEPRSFDVITLWDVIEHIRRPIESVMAANRLLKRNGVLVMKTPNEAGLFKNIALQFYQLFGKRAAFLLKYVYYVPHYFSYSPKTMNKLLEKCGFEAVAYEMDATPHEFAEEKINTHYKKDPKRKWVLALLPIATLLAQITRRHNKMTVYARKVRDV